MSIDSIAQSRTIVSQAGASQGPTQVARAALVIGNGSYRHLPSLTNPLNDAKDMCEAVKRLGFTATCLIDVVNRRALREHFRTFASTVGPGSVALVYYAGHGVQLNGRNYLLPVDIEAQTSADIEDEGVALSYVLSLLADTRSAPNIVILDACRDNPLASRGRDAFGLGLAREDPPLGSILVYATAPNKVAFDGKGRNGLFTKHLLARLEAPGLKLDEMFQLVAQSVEDEARKTYRAEQVPYRSSSFSTPFCLAGCEDSEYAKRLREIEAQSDAASRRIKELTEENAALRRQADDKAASVSALEARISALHREAAASGNQRDHVNSELARLEAELARARAHAEDARLAEDRARGQDAEIAGLRRRLQQLQDQATQMDEYRREIARLRKERDASDAMVQGRSLSKERPTPNIVVPAF